MNTRKRLLTLGLILISTINQSAAKENDFCSDQIQAHPIKHGYTWTLTSRLGELLGMAEKEFGERDKSWTILGTEFNDQNRPRNWHPFEPTKKNIIIQLGKVAANNKKEMLFQLSHEVFHTLSPTGGKNANYFEEGLATYFSINATKKIGIDITPDYIGVGRYRKAYNLILDLYRIHPDASRRIIAFRKLGNTISELDEQQIRVIFPGVKKSLAAQLAKKF